MTKLFAIGFLLSFMVGCSTVTPDYVEDKKASADSSVPEGIGAHKGWFLFSTRDEKGEVNGGVITSQAKERYNNLIKSYRLRFFDVYKVEINENDGVQPYPIGESEHSRSETWFIDAQHLEYYARLSTWAKNGTVDDSVWRKLKDKLTP